MLQTLPKPLVRSISVQLCYPLLCILRIPSLMFVNIVCTLLLQLDEGAFATMNVLDLYAAFRRLLPKNLFHPDTGTAPEGVALSQQQLGFAGLYDQVFAEVRGHAGKLLSVTAKLNPSATNQYVLKLLTDLCPPQGTAEDERTVAGFVTHRSATFTSWECTQFMLSHLFGAFPLCSDYVPECIQALREREPTDAVLQPLYFNMLSYFWTYTGVDALNVWVATLDILFNCVEERARDRRDPDVSAARRRALTLLISVSMEHAAKFVSLVPAVVKRTEALLFSTRTSTEKSLLYESLASFLTCLPVEDADSYLESLLKPVLSILEQHITPMDEALFIQTAAAPGEQDRARREEVRQSLMVLAAVLRRCRQTPYVAHLLGRLGPLVLHAMHLLHSVTPQSLPDGFKAILEMDDQMREQQLPGAKRRSDLSRNAVMDARGFLQSMRYNLYEIFGTLSECLPAAERVEVLRSLGPAAEHAPIHVIRTLTERCLIPMTQSHEELLLHGLAVIDLFFVKRSAVVQAARARAAADERPRGGRAVNQNDDVIDEKQWFYYTKTVMAFIRARVMDTNLWQRSTEYLWGVCQIMTHIFESNTDFKDSSRFLQSLLDLKAEPGCAAGLEEALAQCHMIIYAGLVQYAIDRDRIPMTPKDRETYVYHLVVPYD
ncbi:hypothetical protein STCU_07707 [Strigomonas culicis]|uniref:Uncharacterized protein n=1 Tax=Strigomonas culicis TaxID=28005 RepID=S9U3R2_9TRYP|nr:hypothetical protein STCU_07707 [Strigomonas culicis]|eukprot:EPY23449.1 hypothetical protein STCU_07707 [Strigomonas culicis]